jgi:hypothetical protein
MLSEITLIAYSFFGGKQIVQISEENIEIISDDRKCNDGYLSFKGTDFENKEVPYPTEKLRKQFAKIYMDLNNFRGYSKEEGSRCLCSISGQVCEWAFKDLNPQKVFNIYGNGKTVFLSGN